MAESEEAEVVDKEGEDKDAARGEEGDEPAKEKGDNNKLLEDTLDEGGSKERDAKTEEELARVCKVGATTDEEEEAKKLLTETRPCLTAGQSRTE